MKNLSFTICKNCPAKYIGGNRYLTSWEKKMRKAIVKEVDEEIQKKKDAQNAPSDNPRRRRVIVLDIDLLDEKKFRDKRISQIEKAYRKKHTLDILEKCGLDIEEFNKTKMANCYRTDMLLGCIQDKIDGFDYDEKGTRIPNNKKMDVNNMRVLYEDDVLRIDDGTYTNEFKFDEHEFIYVNGENVFKSSLNPIITPEDEKRMLQDLHDNMEADRLNHERKMKKSLEYAKKFWVKD